MSGGYFDYDQHKFGRVADDIENIIANNAIKDEWGNSRNYGSETLALMRDGIKVIRRAYVYAHRIDYLVSGDDTENWFIERLKDELEELEEK
jgi:hypothetical protein